MNTDKLEKIFDLLNSSQVDSLMAAFDKGESKLLEYAPGVFIGCHLTQFDHLIVELKTEYWCIGQLKNPG